MIGISGIGIYEPQKKITIEELGTHLSIEERDKIGVKSVPIETSLTTTQMAVIASKNAIEDAGIVPLDIDLIINTQASLHDYLLWQVSAAIQNELQACNARFFDVYQGCSGFITGLITAKKFLQGDDGEETILVNTSEKWDVSIKDKILGGLVFGEGGTAAIVQKNSKGNFILGYGMISRGNLNDVSRMTMGAINHPSQIDFDEEDYYYKVTNLEKAKKEMIPINVDLFYQVGEQAVKNSGLTMADISHLIFPNVGFGLFEKVVDRYDMDLNQTNYRYVQETGDCGTVDTLLSYHRMLRDEQLQKDDHVLILAQGAGATWVAIVIKV